MGNPPGGAQKKSNKRHLAKRAVVGKENGLIPMLFIVLFLEKKAKFWYNMHKRIFINIYILCTRNCI